MKPVLMLVITILSSLQNAFTQSVISGRVYNDLSNNSSFDAGEELNNITVWLFDLNAVAPFYRVSPVNTTVTNSSGIYSFNGVSAGNYQVRVMMTSMPVPITRAIADNDSYANGLTEIQGVDGSSAYNNIDFSFANTAAAPVFSSLRNFQFSNTDSFYNSFSKTFNLTSETCNSISFTPTITWTTNRLNTPGGGYGTNSYPQANYSNAVLGTGFPGNNKGGFHPADNTFQLMYGGTGYTAVNNDRQTTTISFSHPVINTKFSIYDIDHADPQVSTGRLDRVKITGFDGLLPVYPVLINPSAVPWNTVSGNTVYGFADYPLSGYSLAFNSQNEDHGTINVYFQNKIDSIEIEYEEWAPVMLPGKGINDATPPVSATNEASWSARTNPATRGISIGSIDYSILCLSLLPVSLLQFSLQKSDCENFLQWKTTSEIQMAYYEVEYSENGRTFISLNKFPAHNDLQNNEYRTMVPFFQGVTYYRIKMADKNETVAYSEILRSSNNCNKLLSWNIIPNPVKKGMPFELNLFNKTGNNKTAYILITDASGKKIFGKTKNIETGPGRFTIQTTNFISGYYLISLYDSESRPIGNTEKFIVN
jgi:hypothetical protein